MIPGKAHDISKEAREIPHIPRVAPVAVSRWRKVVRSSALLCWSVLLLAMGFGGAIWFNGTHVAPPTIVVEGSETESPARKELAYGAQPVLSIGSYFSAMRDDFVAQKADFIEADLATMRLSVYRQGIKELEVPIQTKGKEGSWWETPSGIYAIQSKEKTHFSSFGHVFQPWSMAFQGNFFIHGWPHHPDGTPVQSSYSGGCIRLSNEDAEEVYKVSSVGMPVLVHEQDYHNDSFSYGTKAPEVTADAFLVADLASGAVLAESRSDEVFSVASITKLLTALVAVEHINLDHTVTITDSMRASTSVPRLKVGASVSAYDLLFPLLKESSNEAAEALARHSGRATFIMRMNEKARAVGMEHSVFTDVSGAEAGNVSTANDLFQLARYLINNRSFVLRITADEPINSAYGEPAFPELQNFNVIEGLPGFIGGKVGKSTAAQESGLYLFNALVGGEKRALAVVVLQSTDRDADTKALLQYIEERYQVHLEATPQ